MAYDELSKPLSVTEANSIIKNTLDESFYQIVIKGEISGYRPSPSGHAYFDLKDNSASLPSVVFKSFLYSMPRFQNGDLVIATGRISLYEKSGKLSFIITKLVNAGDGELQALIEKRKAYYQDLGWFDPAIKKPLPKEIKTIGVVTSATGAVFHDILDVTRRRAPGVNIVLFPCSVQGEGAEITISSRIRQANNFDNVDVLIVGRGGGSQEDLSPFSTDEVIIAIHDSHIPVISAVGHEVDWALSDYVADVRAGTPSIAAEMVTKEIFQRRESFSSILSTMALAMKNKLYEGRNRIPSLDSLEAIVRRKLAEARTLIPNTAVLTSILERKYQDSSYRLAMAEDYITSSIKEKIRERETKKNLLTLEISSTLPSLVRERKSQLQLLKKELQNTMRSHFDIQKESFVSKKKEIEALSPYEVLKRGYAVVTNKDGRVVRNANTLQDGDELNIRVEKGNIRTIVQGEKQ